ncbi:malate:quinone oxidoreductase [Mycobacterium sp. AT1]|uniref:malate:quinone oxidoreductase n=1 Tax=Mycobacterium sp. AT1 TaxID=1961706 RepID=UPI0018E91EBD|nr:malate:quinone oxidoreductase [Mycobacterium sp. AT1]
MSIMVDVINRCFSDDLKNDGWAERLKGMIPSYGESLVDDADLCRRVRANTATVLQVNQ